MIRFIQLAAICRLVGGMAGYSRKKIQEMACDAIERDQCLKVMAAAGRIGLS